MRSGTLRLLTSVLLVAGLLVCPTRALADDAPSAPSVADIQKAFEAVKVYKFGQSRKPLTAAAKLAHSTAGHAAARAAVRKCLLDLLGSGEASVDVKRWSCEQLYRIGQADDVPAVAKLLTDKTLSHMARFALEGIGGEASRKALAVALPQTSGRQLAGVINSLGHFKYAPAADALAKLAASKDADVANAALLALGDIGTTKAFELLTNSEGGVAVAQKPALLHAKLKFADAFATAGKKSEAEAIYRALFTKSQPRHIRAAALGGLVATRGAKANATLIELLLGEDRHMQLLAAGHVRTMKDKQAVAAIAGQLPKLPPSGQVALIRALAARPDAREHAALTAAVVKAAGGKEGEVRAAAVAALASVGDASAVDVLIGLIVAAGPDAGAARTSLIRLRGKDVDPKLIAKLPSSAPKTQVELIRALSQRRAAGTERALLAVAKAPDAGAGGEALKALVVLADDSALAALIGVVTTSKDAARRDLAGKAVEAICKRIEDKDMAAAPLLVELAKAPAPVKVSLLAVLGRIGGAKALGAIRSSSKDADASVRDAAIRALVAWPEVEAMDDLLALAKSAASDVHRVLAFRGYVRLIGAAARPADQTVQLYKSALAAAPRAEDKKLVLGALGGRDDLTSLSLAMECVSQPSLRAEALAATFQIASACGGAYPKQVRAAMEKLIATAGDPAVVARAKVVIQETTGELRVALNFAGEGTATSPDGWDGDGESRGDAAAIDGKETTYWDEVNGKKLYRLVVTYKQPRAIGGIGIVPFAPTQYAPTTFDILCDGKVVKAVKGGTYPGGFLAVVFPETTAKALELKITGYSGGSPAIRELSIYGRKARATTLAKLKKGGRKVNKVAQLANGAWIIR